MIEAAAMAMAEVLRFMGRGPFIGGCAGLW
jgi:hypothetical protein